jgi:hypothetical protein
MPVQHTDLEAIRRELQHVDTGHADLLYPTQPNAIQALRKKAGSMNSVC